MPVYLQMENPYIIQPDAARRNWIKEYNTGNYDGIIDLKNDTYYVEGQTQIKSAENNIGTFSKYEGDINYALDIDSDENGISGAEVKKSKASGKTKAQIRAEQVVENQKVRTKAEYTTDKVFSQASVKRGFDSIEAVKKLPSDVRDNIARKLWIELEMSEGDEVRDTFALKYSIELYQAIRDSGYENFENMSPQQKDVLQAQLRDAVREIIKSGKESKLSRMKKDVRGTVKLEERVRSEYLSGIYQTLKKIDDKKKHRFASASAYKGDLFKSTIDRLTRITSCSSSRSILSYLVLTMVAPIAVSSTSAKPSF